MDDGGRLFVCACRRLLSSGALSLAVATSRNQSRAACAHTPEWPSNCSSRCAYIQFQPQRCPQLICSPPSPLSTPSHLSKPLLLDTHITPTTRAMPSPIASPSTPRPVFFGLFDRPVTISQEVDVEAQLAQPTPAFTHASRATRVSVEETTDAIDDFFGASHRSTTHHARDTSLSGTRDSRHDDLRLSSPVDDASDLLPPPYEQSLLPPAYSQVSDQPTLAMYLFKFGFREWSCVSCVRDADADCLAFQCSPFSG